MSKCESKKQLELRDRRVLAVQSLQIKGAFFQEFDLHSYPFDVQPMNVKLGSAGMEKDTCEFVFKRPPEELPEPEATPEATATSPRMPSQLLALNCVS